MTFWKSMKVAGCLFVVWLFPCSRARAQEIPNAEIFGGYSYLNLDTNGLSSRQSANGWDASATFNVNRWVGVEADFAGYYKTITSVNVHDYSFAFGPRFSYRENRSTSIFAHALFGGDNLTGSAIGGSATQTGFAAIFGAGVEWKVRPASRWGVRVSGDYVLSRHDIVGAESFTQNNYRASVGVIYSFGGMREGAPRTPRELKQEGKSKEERPSAGPECVAAQASATIGVEGCEISNGFFVTKVVSGGVANGIGIHPADTIIEIEGQRVKSAAQIEAIAKGKTKVEIGFMLEGKWLIQRTATMR
jgi:hypothetical protein